MWVESPRWFAATIADRGERKSLMSQIPVADQPNPYQRQFLSRRCQRENSRKGSRSAFGSSSSPRSGNGSATRHEGLSGAVHGGENDRRQSGLRLEHGARRILYGWYTGLVYQTPSSPASRPTPPVATTAAPSRSATATVTSATTAATAWAARRKAASQWPCATAWRKPSSVGALR